MHDSMAAARRLALRAAILQAVVAAAVALVFAFEDSASALAAGSGGGAVVVGNALLALRSLSGPPRGAGIALAQLLTGFVLKWIVVLGTLYLAFARWHLPPLPLLAGVVATTLAFLFIGKNQTRV